MAKTQPKTRPDRHAVTFVSPAGEPSTPGLDAVVLDVIGRIADKWTLLVLEVLAQDGVLRFTRIGQRVGNISQRMLTKTLRQLEEDGLVLRTAHPEVPPRVEYQLTALGESLCAALCGMWTWAFEHQDELLRLRAAATAGQEEAKA
ncbi:transcriptional regulator [Burkholderia sp. WAC0059]|uniref:winged helix-turn-helix transcriptional regulator n=1 Tax=Burkholderia sp. WAC0059 TaxID=2066022 RepID=UPI000C7E8EB7|nr:helix-turn-helix domain-containing protein [Burkholderia sp. WAC0059]PLZ01025.1 transcriptional regulator [Burkholderia sp. WAC0059]